MKLSLVFKNALFAIFSLGAVTLVLTPIARAISLNDLQQKALANRKIIEKYQVAIEQGKKDIKIGKSRFLPSFDIAYTTRTLDEDTLLENNENSTFDATLSYALFTGFKDKYDLKSFELIKESKSYELKSILNNINYRVAVGYLDVFMSKNNLEIAEDEYQLIAKRLKDTENRHKVGLIRKNELLKIKVELADAEQKRQKAKTEFIKKLHLLEWLINDPISPEELNYEEFSELPAIKPVSAYESVMLREKNEIKALETVKQASRYGVSAAKAEFYPRIDATLGYQRTGDNYFLGIDNDNEDALYLQMQLKMNLYNGSEKYARVDKAKLEIRRIESDLIELKKRLSTDLKNICLDFEVDMQNLTVAQSSIAQAEENLRITDLSFREGVETATDVLDAIYNLSRAKYNHINARNAVFLDYYRLLNITDGFKTESLFDFTKGIQMLPGRCFGNLLFD